jgi:hypothetical protein
LRPQKYVKATFYRTSGSIELVALHCPSLQSGFFR